MERPEGKKLLGGPRRRWEDNIKIDLSVVGHAAGNWIELAEDRDPSRVYARALMNSGSLETNLLYRVCQNSPYRL